MAENTSTTFAIAQPATVVGVNSKSSVTAEAHILLNIHQSQNHASIGVKAGGRRIGCQHNRDEIKGEPLEMQTGKLRRGKTIYLGTK